MAFDNSYTAVTGATYQASDYNTGTKGNFTAVWVGTTAGDLDYYTGATAKNRLALVTGGLLYGGASAPAWLAKVTGGLLYGGASAPAYLANVAGGLLYGAASAPDYLPIQNSYRLLMSGGTNPFWASLVQLRQGGDANNWQIGGTTTRNPADSFLQVGCIDITTNGSGVGSAVVTYPSAFAQRPLIIATVGGSSTGKVNVTFSDDSVSGCTLRAYNIDVGAVTIQVNWLAIGTPF